ncbi:MAG: DegT/DnrJ/EryC1/StrS family aminotransferase [Candidatus Hydrothermae bacterium]|nr:DegT/DnrJ/EryC1/StrS family aminotransferase [Candidatus Hydrothermae bacterium]
MDLKAQLHTIYGELDSMFTDIITHNAFVAGDYVRKFEEEFAKYLGVKHVVTASSGTTALFMALLALGIGEGDEVITVPFTFVATLEAIVYTGATPVFVDIDPTTYNMDPAKLRKVITNRTRAIVPVHLYGQPADMNPILELAEKYDLKVIEDACQAHGALYRGKRAGAIGDAAAFSFYPGKNLGSWGEAGAVSTNNDQLAEKLRKLRDHGAEKKYFHLTRGLNLRTINFQGAVLSVKLKHLDSWNDRRREIAFLYNELLEDVKEVVTPYESTFVKHVYHLYVIRAERRDALRSFLSERGIDTGIHYPIPLHLQKAYEGLGYVRGDFPNAEEAALSVLSLPMFPELTDDEVERVAKTIKEFYS